MVAVFLPLAVVIGIAGGPIVVVVPVLACVAYWRPHWLPWVAFDAMLLTGVVTVTGHPATMGSGAFSGLAQACALLALTAALIPDTARKAPGPAGHQEDVP
jgi:arabinofuranan 3-O-arabinosyltransferase